MTTFTVVDVETANHSRASVCQIGIVQVRDGRICGEWHKSRRSGRVVSFVPHRAARHRCERRFAAHRPFPISTGNWGGALAGLIAVGHSSFDEQALNQTAEKYNLPIFPVTWLDSIVIARDAWPGLPSYRLEQLAEMLSIDFRHHDALEDARATAEVVLRACAATGRNIESWL